MEERCVPRPFWAYNTSVNSCQCGLTVCGRFPRINAALQHLRRHLHTLRRSCQSRVPFWRLLGLFLPSPCNKLRWLDTSSLHVCPIQWQCNCLFAGKPAVLCAVAPRNPQLHICRSSSRRWRMPTIKATPTRLLVVSSQRKHVREETSVTTAFNPPKQHLFLLFLSQSFDEELSHRSCSKHYCTPSIALLCQKQRTFIAALDHPNDLQEISRNH